VNLSSPDVCTTVGDHPPAFTSAAATPGSEAMWSSSLLAALLTWSCGCTSLKESSSYCALSSRLAIPSAHQGGFLSGDESSKNWASTIDAAEPRSPSRGNEFVHGCGSITSVVRITRQKRLMYARDFFRPLTLQVERIHHLYQYWSWSNAKHPPHYAQSRPNAATRRRRASGF
jgi:hypothetical protein